MARGKPTSIDRFGRILIPRDLRERVGLTSGREVRIVAARGELRLIPDKISPRLKKEGALTVIVGNATADVDIVRLIERARAKRIRTVLGKKR